MFPMLALAMGAFPPRPAEPARSHSQAQAVGGATRGGMGREDESRIPSSGQIKSYQERGRLIRCGPDLTLTLDNLLSISGP